VSGIETISHGNCVRADDSAKGILRFTTETLEFKADETEHPIWSIRLDQIQRLSLIGPTAVVITDLGRTDFEGSDAERITRALAAHLKGSGSIEPSPREIGAETTEESEGAIPEPGSIPFPAGKVLAEEMCVWLPGTQALAGMMAVTTHGIAFSRDLSAAMMTSNVVWALSSDQVEDIIQGDGNTTSVVSTDGTLYRFMGQGAVRASAELQRVLDGTIQELDAEPVHEQATADEEEVQQPPEEPVAPSPPPVPTSVSPVLPNRAPVPDEVLLKERFTQRRGPVSVPGTLIVTTKGFRFDAIGALSFLFGGDLRVPLKNIQNVKYTSDEDCEIWVDGASHLFRGAGAERLHNALKKLRQPAAKTEGSTEETQVTDQPDPKPVIPGLLPISRILGNLQQLTIYLGNEPLFIALGSSVFLLDDGLGFAFPRVPPTQLNPGMRIRCEVQKELGTYVFDADVLRTGNKNFDVSNDERESWYMLVVTTPHGVQNQPAFEP
tara:strand:+ start:1451 stop:2932 length:1482 start_codon:yes stop_codon:yes gene_type:complete